jgi:HEPN domain-containing protein
MSAEACTWLRYAEENLAVARLSLDGGYLNSCLQNAQQAIEKAIKAVIIVHRLEFRRTHSIQELAGMLTAARVASGITEDECDVVDAVYLPSKYPLTGLLPQAEPEAATCAVCIGIAERVVAAARQCLPSAF